MPTHEPLPPRAEADSPEVEVPPHRPRRATGGTSTVPDERGTARTSGAVFRLRGCSLREPLLADAAPARLLREIGRRVAEREAELQRPVTRIERLSVAGSVWRDAGSRETDRLRREFLRITTRLGVPHLTAVKTLRRRFATSLQDANVDPPIRCELMGHSVGSGGHSLGTTAIHTHTRVETKRRQLEQAHRPTPAYAAVEGLVSLPERSAFDT